MEEVIDDVPLEEAAEALALFVKPQHEVEQEEPGLSGHDDKEAGASSDDQFPARQHGNTDEHLVAGSDG